MNPAQQRRDTTQLQPVCLAMAAAAADQLRPTVPNRLKHWRTPHELLVPWRIL